MNVVRMIKSLRTIYTGLALSLMGCIGAGNESINDGTGGLRIEVVSQFDSSGIIMSTENELLVRVIDNKGKPATGIDVLFERDAGDHDLIILSSVAATDSKGVARSKFKAPTTVTNDVKIKAYLREFSAVTHEITFNVRSDGPPRLVALRFDPFASPPSTYAAAVTAMAAMPTFRVQGIDQYGQLYDPDAYEALNPDEAPLSRYDIQLSVAVGDETLLIPNNSASKIKTLNAGVAEFSGLRYVKAGAMQLRATAIGATSSALPLDHFVNVTPNIPWNLVIRMPGETLVQGVTSKAAAISGTPSTQRAGVLYKADLYVVDEGFNIVTTANGNNFSVSLEAGSSGTLTSSSTFLNGRSELSITPSALGSQYVKINSVSYASIDSARMYSGNPATVVPGIPVKLAISQQPVGPATAGSAFPTPIRIQAQDIYNNYVNLSAPNEVTNLVTLKAYTDTNCTSEVGIPGALKNASGNLVLGSREFSTLNYEKTGVIYLKAEASGLSSSACSQAITVNPGAVSKLAFALTPSTTGTAGSAISPNVAVEISDAFDNLVNVGPPIAVEMKLYTNATCTTEAAPLTPLNQTAKSGHNVNTISGRATFSALRYDVIGRYYYKAFGGSLETSCSSFYTDISPSAAADFVFVQVPGPGDTLSADLVISPAPQIRVIDAFGNTSIVPTATATITTHVAGSCSTNKSGTLSGNAGVSLASGTATFSSLYYRASGPVRFKVTLDQNSSVNRCFPADVTINPGTAATLAWSTQPSSDTADNALGTPSVQIKDAHGNNVSNNYTVDLSAHTDASCSAGNLAPTQTLNNITALDGNSVQASAAGLASFSALRYRRAQDIYFKASSPSLPGVFSPCSSKVTVSSGSINRIDWGTLFASTQSADNVFSPAPTVRALDAFDNPVTNTNHNIRITAHSEFDGSGCTTTAVGSVSADQQTTNMGVATFTSIAYRKATNTTFFPTSKVYFKASVITAGGITPLCSSGTTINPGTPTKLAYKTAVSGNFIAGAPFSFSPEIEIRDAHDNLTGSSAGVTLKAWVGADANCVGGSQGGGTLGGVTSDTASSGIADFTGLSYTKAETIRLRAEATGLSSVCSGNIVITHAAANKLAFVTGISWPSTRLNNIKVERR